jgi:hypothetical protein
MMILLYSQQISTNNDEIKFFFLSFPPSKFLQKKQIRFILSTNCLLLYTFIPTQFFYTQSSRKKQGVRLFLCFFYAVGQLGWVCLQNKRKNEIYRKFKIFFHFLTYYALVSLYCVVCNITFALQSGLFTKKGIEKCVARCPSGARRKFE